MITKILSLQTSHDGTSSPLGIVHSLALVLTHETTRRHELRNLFHRVIDTFYFAEPRVIPFLGELSLSPTRSIYSGSPFLCSRLSRPALRPPLG